MHEKLIQSISHSSLYLTGMLGGRSNSVEITTHYFRSEREVRMFWENLI